LVIDDMPDDLPVVVYARGDGLEMVIGDRKWL
jgi:hypothetical protein